MLSNFYQSCQLLKIPRTLTLLIILTIGVANSAVAESLNEYCITQVSQQEVKKPPKNAEEGEKYLPPFIGSVENLPELYQNPCNEFSIECIPDTFFSYSPTLDRVFVNGYRQTNWWGGFYSLERGYFNFDKGFVNLEISKSGTKSVPNALLDSNLGEDLPALNGVLFGGNPSGEVLFYDGKHVTNISSHFPRMKGKHQKRNWNFKKIANGRMFFVSTGDYSRGLPFIIELKKGLQTTLIPVPKELENTWLEFFVMPDNSRLWGVTRYSILREIEGKLQNVFTVSSPLYIIGPSGIDQLPNGSIAFQVENEDTKSITNYVLKQALAKDNCEIRLNADKPVLLQSKSEINNHKQLKVNIDKIINSLLKFFKVVN